MGGLSRFGDTCELGPRELRSVRRLSGSCTASSAAAGLTIAFRMTVVKYGLGLKRPCCRRAGSARPKDRSP